MLILFKSYRAHQFNLLIKHHLPIYKSQRLFASARIAQADATNGDTWELYSSADLGFGDLLTFGRHGVTTGLVSAGFA